MCRQNIYYGDTIKYYDKYENEIMDELVLNYGTEFLVDLFKDADASLTIYKNSVTWAFIELTAFEAVNDHNYEYAQANLEPLPSETTEELGNKIMAMGL